MQVYKKYLFLRVFCLRDLVSLAYFLQRHNLNFDMQVGVNAIDMQVGVNAIDMQVGVNVPVRSHSKKMKFCETRVLGRFLNSR